MPVTRPGGDSRVGRPRKRPASRSSEAVSRSRRPRWPGTASRRTGWRTTVSCARAASSTSTAMAGRSCGWTRRRRCRAPRSSQPRCRTQDADALA